MEPRFTSTSSTGNKKRRGKRSERGNALLEFALAFPVLWLMFAGVYQFGYAFYAYNLLQTAVANAAQLGSKINYDTGSPTAFQTELQNMVVYGNETAGTTPLIPGLTTSDVTVVANPASYPTSITVEIGSYTIDAIFKKFTLTNKPRATVAYYGQINCASCP